jgi:ankyrin repeat protein
VGALDGDHDTPLHLAADQGKLAAARLLLERGAGVHVRNKLGRTPLHDAMPGGFLDVVRLLLEHGADVEARDDDHVTPLHVAAQSGKYEAVQVLLDDGAKAHVRDKTGQTPFDLASTDEVKELLRKHELGEPNKSFHRSSSRDLKVSNLHLSTFAYLRLCSRDRGAAIGLHTLHLGAIKFVRQSGDVIG